MKTNKRLLAVALTVAVIAFAESVSAQRLLNGNGAGVGSRIGHNRRARMQSADETIIELPVEETAATAAQQTATAAQDSAQAPLKKSDGSEFVLSATATIDELIEKANSLMSTSVAFETQEEYDEWIGKMLETVGKIGDRILKMKPNDEQFVQGIALKGQSLCYQASIDSASLPKLGAFADALEKNAKVQGLEGGRQAAMAFRGVYLQAKVAEVAEQNGSVQDLNNVMKEVSAFIAAHPEASDMTVDLVFPVALVAENQKQPKLPAQIWTPIRKQLAASDSQEAKAALQLLEGTIRYSELEGNAFKWNGCLADGTKFDPASVKGKVVLVDFWASWCEPCGSMHAQLKELYEKYHSQGFEIVGYNLDAEQADIDAYLKKDPLPWILMSDRATVDAKETSIAAYYGISEIPTMLLIGGDGKVAALDISMESLIATLESVFSKSGVNAQTTGTTKATGKTTGKTTSGTATSKSAAAKTGKTASATRKN